MEIEWNISEIYAFLLFSSQLQVELAGILANYE